MDGALRILQNEKPDLFFIGLISPNIVGHIYQTESDEIEDAMKEVDKQIGRLIDFLKNIGWFENTLIVITADHGMADKPYGIDLIGALKRNREKAVVQNIAYRYQVPAVGGLYLYDESPAMIDRSLNAIKEITGIKGAWHKYDPDAPWFIRRGAHERAPDLLCVPEYRYQIVAQGATEPVYPAYHGAPYYADFSIMMIFSGCGVRRMGTVATTDIPLDAFLSDTAVSKLLDQTHIAPTIMRALGIL
jgi:hypothetical protein